MRLRIDKRKNVVKSGRQLFELTWRMPVRGLPFTSSYYRIFKELFVCFGSGKTDRNNDLLSNRFLHPIQVVFFRISGFRTKQNMGTQQTFLDFKS